MKKFLLMLNLLTLVSCTSNEIYGCKDCVPAPTSILISNEKPKLGQINDKLLTDTKPKLELSSSNQDLKNTHITNNEFSTLLGSLSTIAQKKWGKDGYVQSSKHRYVKYFDSYLTKADIQFDKGKIHISTISKADIKEKLTKATVQILLMSDEFHTIGLFNSDNIISSSNPFFFEQILDHEDQPIRWEWRANQFAQYLLENKLLQYQIGDKTVHTIEIDLVENHLAIRENRYSKLVTAFANKYQISEELIDALIKIESSYNPFAISQNGAIGMMQVLPSGAGLDVFKFIKNTNGYPTSDYLFDIKNNLDTGIAYLHILNYRYLKDLAGSYSKSFALISAYHSGTKAMLSTFNPNKLKAIDQINAIESREVYRLLTTKHPKKETRDYLIKVLEKKRDFDIQNI